MQPEAAANVIEDKDHPIVVAHFPDSGEKSFHRQLGVVSRVVLERRENHGRDLPAILLDHLPQALEIVVAEVNNIRAILRRNAGGKRRAPRMRAMVSALAHRALGPARRMARDLGRPRAYVGAVLREHRPLRKRRDRYQVLRELDPKRPRRIETIPKFRLPPRGLINLRMPMP